MTRDDVIRIAEEAGFDRVFVEKILLPAFENFAALVAAAERKACAELCLEIRHDNITEVWSVGARACAEAIWARGRK